MNKVSRPFTLPTPPFTPLGREDHVTLPLLQELQKLEAQWRDQDKGKASHALQIKELEHKIAKFQKDSREAAQRVGGDGDCVVGGVDGEGSGVIQRFSCVERCVHMYSVFCHHVLCFLFAELSVLVWLACLPTCALCWHGGDLYKAHHTFPNPHYKPSPLKTSSLQKPSPLQNLNPHP